MIPEDTMQLPLLSVRHIQGISGMSCGSDPCRYNADASRICEINTGNQLYALVPKDTKQLSEWTGDIALKTVKIAEKIADNLPADCEEKQQKEKRNIQQTPSTIDDITAYHFDGSVGGYYLKIKTELSSLHLPFNKI